MKTETCTQRYFDLIKQHLVSDPNYIITFKTPKKTCTVASDEVDMLLHLCLTSRAEREEMIWLLSPRLKLLPQTFYEKL